MRIRFRIQLTDFVADSVPDLDPDFYFMRMRIRMRIQVTKMMRILPDPDPQHCAESFAYMPSGEMTLISVLIFNLSLRECK
jgi:hypothetical protein